MKGRVPPRARGDITATDGEGLTPWLAPERTRPLAVAHRGFSGRYPENTRAAFDAAVALGAPAMELDVQLARDGMPLVFHDRTLEKANRPDIAVADLDAAELLTLDVGRWRDPCFAGAAMPTLADVVARYGRRCTLMVEVKCRERAWPRLTALLAATAAACRAGNLAGRCLLLCYDLALLRHGYARFPEFHYVWNLAQPVALDPVETRFLSAFSVSIERLDESFVRTAHGLGKPVYTFTVNTAAELERARAHGVDAIMSDRPDWLMDALAARP